MQRSRGCASSATIADEAIRSWWRPRRPVPAVIGRPSRTSSSIGRVRPEVVDPPPVAVQHDPEDQQRQVVQLVGRAGHDRPWPVAVPPPAGQTRQPSPDHVAREVLLGDRDLAPFPALTQLVQVRQHDVAERRRQREVRQQPIEYALRRGFVEVVQRAAQRTCELVQFEAAGPSGPSPTLLDGGAGRALRRSRSAPPPPPTIPGRGGTACGEPGVRRRRSRAETRPVSAPGSAIRSGSPTPAARDR